MYQYPYGNAQQLNLDWLMEQWQTVKQSIDGSLQGEIDRVEAAITDLLAARDAAVAAAGAANTSAGAAAASAQAAAADAATATAQAAAATQERVNAAQAANNAQSYAGTAQTQATAAQNAAGQAAASASQAAADASDAHDDAVAASGSAVNAAASAAGALQNFQLSDAARQAAQAAATLLQPPATSADIGKALIVKTVGGGTVTAYELGESGGGGGGTPAIVNTIEDVPVASFDDGTDNPVQQIVVNIEPVQASGTPTPENPLPITGWTGANVYRTGKNLFPDAGDITVIGTLSYLYTKPIIIKGQTITLSFSDINWGSGYTSSVIFLIGKNNAPILNLSFDTTHKSRTYTATEDIYGLNFYATSSGSTNPGVTTVYYDAQIELASTPTSYEPFNGITYPITFPTEAGTVYGGTLTNLGTNEWKLRIDTAIGTIDGSAKPFATKTAYTTNTAFYASATLAPNSKKPDTNASIPKMISNCFSGGLSGNKVISTDVIAISMMADGRIVCGFGLSTTITTLEDANAFAQSQPITFTYEIENPVEYTITTADVILLLAGYNNVWADTGNINLLQYFADSKKYIDEQDALIKALIAPVLDSMIADTALTANDFRIVDNTLYRITAPVAAGAALTPNTNCTATTIGAILKTLLT